ncbi:carbohydrate kinase family protein [Candidatus Woesearchaeota archaeon]|nr:carbohydrate kinase family protein [Candidatus Woesearchaeota archaeon]
MAVKKRTVKKRMAVDKKKTAVKKRAGRNTGFDVISVGSAAVDCFVSLPTDLKSIKHGSKVLIKDIHLLTGGGGTNVAVGMSRLGLRTGFIGEVGDDLSAHMIEAELKKEGVEFLVKKHSRHMTAYSVVLEAKGKDRAILVHKGASSYLHPYEIPKSRLKTGWFYFASVMGESFRTMTTLARLAKKRKISIYFNPSGYMIAKGGKELEDILAATKILAVNKEEAQTLLKTRSNVVETLLLGMHRLGPEICIITDSKNGAYVYDGEHVYKRKPQKTAPVDTTGAGDAFGAGFLSGYIMKSSLKKKERISFALRMGLAESVAVIKQVGSKKGLLTKRQLLKAMKS